MIHISLRNYVGVYCTAPLGRLVILVVVFSLVSSSLLGGDLLCFLMVNRWLRSSILLGDISVQSIHGYVQTCLECTTCFGAQNLFV